MVVGVGAVTVVVVDAASVMESVMPMSVHICVGPLLDGGVISAICMTGSYWISVRVSSNFMTSVWEVTYVGSAV